MKCFNLSSHERVILNGHAYVRYNPHISVCKRIITGQLRIYVRFIHICKNCVKTLVLIDLIILLLYNIFDLGKAKSNAKTELEKLKMADMPCEQLIKVCLSKQICK